MGEGGHRHTERGRGDTDTQNRTGGAAERENSTVFSNMQSCQHCRVRPSCPTDRDKCQPTEETYYLCEQNGKCVQAMIDKRVVTSRTTRKEWDLFIKKQKNQDPKWLFGVMIYVGK